MGILIALFVLLFLLLLLSMPLIVEANARIGVRGAIVHARVYVLGLIPIPVRLRLYLLHTPYFTLQIGKKRVRLLGKRKKRGKTRIAGVRLLRLDARTTVGIEDDPATAVVFAGSLAVLFSMFITRAAESGSARAALCAAPMLRISLKTQAIVEPLALAAGFLRGRIAGRKAANNTRKIHEKRTTYASC